MLHKVLRQCLLWGTTPSHRAALFSLHLPNHLVYNSYECISGVNSCEPATKPGVEGDWDAACAG